MLGIRLVRPTATRALAFTVLVATYGGGALSIAGIAATTGASTAFAKSNRGFSSSYSVGNRMSSAGAARSGNNYRNYGPRYGVGNQMSGTPQPSKTYKSGTPKPPKTYVSGAPKPPKTGKPVSRQGYSTRTNTASSSPSVGSAGEIRSAGASFGRGPVYAATGPSGTAIATCAQRYRSYDRVTMTYTDANGRRRSCP